MTAQEIFIFADPQAEGGVTVEQLRAHLEGRHDKERVVIATGDGRASFLPVLGLADDQNRVVMEL